MKSKFNEALTFFKKGQLKEAKNLCLEILKEDSNNFDVLYILGVINFREKNFTESKDLIEKAIKIKPNSFEIHNFFGFVLLNLKKFDLAVKSWDEAIKLNPNYAEGYNNRGNIFFMLENLDEALKSYEKAIQLKPNYPDAHNNRGNALSKLNKKNDAIESYQKATKLNPNYAQAYKNLGSVFRQVNDIDDAIESYKKAIEINPNYSEAFLDLGNIFRENGKNIFAINNYEKAIKLKPNFDFLLGTIIHTKLKICQWDTIEKNLREVEEKVLNQKKISQPWVFLTFNDSPNLQKITSKLWSNREIFLLKKKLEPITQKLSNKKIRIGYYSADFYNHATSQLMANLFELHDKSKFEIFGFNFGPEKNDEMYKRVIKAFDKFFNLSNKTDLEIAEISREHKIDIAVDLKGFTQKNRFRIFIERCAPIQVSYLGYPGTTGAECIDYVIADKILIPTNSQQHYSEKIIYLPNSYQANDTKTIISEKIFSKEEFGLPKNSFIFCSFNACYKILPTTFDVWMKILKRVDNSILWLLADDIEIIKNIKEETIKRGIDPERIIFAKRLTLSEHLSRQKLANLFIDTFPCTGHTTCSDALRSGLPVLTLLGKSFAGRVSSSLLNAVDLKELITKTPQEYEDLAVRLANDSSRLENIRKKLEVNIKTKPLFDCKLFTSHIEKAYLEIYRKHSESNKIDNIEIE